MRMRVLCVVSRRSVLANFKRCNLVGHAFTINFFPPAPVWQLCKSGRQEVFLKALKTEILIEIGRNGKLAALP